MPGFPHSPPPRARYRILAGAAALVGLLAYLFWPESPSEAPTPEAPQLQARPSFPPPEQPPEPALKQRTYELVQGDGVTFDPHAQMLHCETPFLDDALPVTVRVHVPLARLEENRPPNFSVEQIVEITDGALSLSFHEEDWSININEVGKTGVTVPSIPIEYIFPDGSAQVVTFPSETMCPKDPDEVPRDVEVDIIVENYDLIHPDDRHDISELQGYVAGIDNCGRQVPVIDGRATIKQASGTTCPITAYRWDGSVRVQGESMDVTFDESLQGPIILTLPNELHGRIEFDLAYHEDSPPTLEHLDSFCDISGGALDAELLVDAQLLEVDGTSLQNLRQESWNDYYLLRDLFTGPVNEARPWTILPRGSDTPLTFDAVPCRTGMSPPFDPEWLEGLNWALELRAAFREERLAKELSGSP